MRATSRAGLALAVTLAAVAGCVDAVGFERVFDVFPANQSGNAVLLGVALGHGSAGEAWRPALAIVGFGFGIAAAIVLGARVGPRRRSPVLLAIEALLLVPLLLVLVDDPRAARLGDITVAVLLALSACAMGIQTEVIGRAAGVAVATTYQTGAITRIAEAVALRVSPGGRLPTVGPAVIVLLLVLVAYIAGATLGAALRSSRFAMVVPVALLAVTGAVLAIGLRRRGTGNP